MKNTLLILILICTLTSCNFFEKYDKIGTYNNRLAIVEKDGKYGLIDIDGLELIPCVYDKIYPFTYGLAVVKKDNKYGFINKDGEEKIPLIYDYVDSFKIDKTGAIVAQIYVRPPNVTDWYHGFMGTMNFGFINTNGDEIMPPIYERSHVSKDGSIYLVKKKDSGWGAVTSQNKEIMPFIYSNMNFADTNRVLQPVSSSNVFTVQDSLGKWGLFDPKGIQMFPFESDKRIFNINYFRDYFNNDTYVIRKNGKRGLLDKNGAITCEPIFNDFDPTHRSEWNGFPATYQTEYEKRNGYEVVATNDSLHGYIDKNGFFVFHKKIEQYNDRFIINLK